MFGYRSVFRLRRPAALHEAASNAGCAKTCMVTIGMKAHGPQIVFPYSLNVIHCCLD